MTPQEAAKATRALGKGLTGAITRPMNETRRRATAEARRDFKTQNPGRSIFGFKGGRGRPPLKISGRAARLSQTHGAFVVQIIIAGMAALIEEGGRTRPPRRGGVILPVKAKALRFQGRSGVVFAPQVKHPGARVPKNPIGRKAVERTFRDLPPAIDRSLQEAVKVVGLE